MEAQALCSIIVRTKECPVTPCFPLTSVRCEEHAEFWILFPGHPRKRAWGKSSNLSSLLGSKILRSRSKRYRVSKAGRRMHYKISHGYGSISWDHCKRPISGPYLSPLIPYWLKVTLWGVQLFLHFSVMLSTSHALVQHYSNYDLWMANYHLSMIR